MRRILAICLAVVLCLGALTGCGGNNASTRAFTVNGTNVMMDEAMYYIYAEEQAYSVYDQLYQMMYGFSFWDSTQDGTTSMAQTVKHEIVTMGAWYTILSEEAKAKGFTLSEEDTAQIAEDVQSIYDELSDAQKKNTGLTVDSLVKTLSKIKLAGEYYVDVVSNYDVDREAIRAGVDYKTYRQYDIEMLEVTFSSSDGTMMDEPDQKLLIKKIDSYVADAELGKDLAGLLDEDEEQIKYNSLSFTANDLTSNELYAVASELENGKVTTYQSSVSYYLIRMVDNDSHEAYEKEIQTEIKAAENEKFVEAYSSVADNAKITVSRYFDKLVIGKITADETTTADSSKE